MRRSAVSAACLLLPLAGAALTSAPAAAGVITAASIAGGFNLVAESDVSSTNDIEGNAIIGGNLNGGPNFFNNAARAPANAFTSIYGSVNVSTNVDGGTLYYGALGGGGSINLNNGSTSQQGNFPNPLAAYTAPLIAMSQQLSLQAQQSGNTTSVASNALTFNATAGDASGVAYFDFTTAQLLTLLNSASTINVNLSGTATSIVVNVDGSSFTSPSSLNAPNAIQDLLFNFYDATSLNLDSWQTSVLAPDAATTTENAFQGFLFTDTLNAGGELHNLPYTGSLPPPSNSPSVPEPASIALLAAGLAALGARRARRAPAGASAHRLA